MKPLTNEEVLDLINNRGLTLKQVIDVYIDKNSWKGMTLIKWSKEVREYIQGNPEQRVTNKTKIDGKA